MRRALPLLALSLAAAFAAAQDGQTTPPATTPPAPTQPDPIDVARTDNYLGVNVGVYLPFDSDVRDAFGSAPISYGIGLAQPYRTARRGPRFDFTALSLNSDGNNFFLVGGTVGYEVQGLKQRGRPTGFARVGIGPAFYHYDVDFGGNRGSVDGNTISFIGTAEVGYTFGERFILSARGLLTPSLDSLNFTGIQVSLTYAAFKL